MGAGLRFIVLIAAIFFFSVDPISAQNNSANMSLNVIDPATGAGLDGVRIRWRDFRSGGQIKGEVLTDSSGNALIPMPAKGVQFFQLYLSKQGYVTLRAFWPYSRGRGMVGDVEGTQEPPQVYDITMEAAHKASGKVVDDNNKPIEDAIVTISANKKLTTANTATDILDRQVKTDADGVFSIDDAPSPIDSAYIRIFHPLFGSSTPIVAPAKLLDGSAVFTLPKGVMIEGAITSADGKPIAGATVLLGTSLTLNNKLPSVTTDAAGKYQIGAQKNSSATLTVTMRGQAPELKTVDIKAENSSVNFQLKPARRVAGKVVPPAGQAFPGGYVYVSGWRDAHTITQQIFFGSDGRFSLSDMPLDEVELLIKSYGDNSYTTYTLKASDKDVTIELK